jgi:hypothetical protein
MTPEMSQLRHSMHEMYEIGDLNSFGDVMDDIHVKTAAPPPEESRDGDDDFLFIADNPPLRCIGSSAKPRLTQAQVTIGCSSTIRRSMSIHGIPPIGS